MNSVRVEISVCFVHCLSQCLERSSSLTLSNKLEKLSKMPNLDFKIHENKEKLKSGFRDMKLIY